MNHGHGKPESFSAKNSLARKCFLRRKSLQTPTGSMALFILAKVLSWSLHHNSLLNNCCFKISTLLKI